jgi:CRISPR/Cas system CSM-associated protein Csm3 (group 7 of RAMP superfamily)
METKTIKYTITFLSDWHAGSGLSSGAEADAVVVKDKDNLPYLPGKTIKGLLKDAILDMKEVQPTMFNENDMNGLFGFEIIDEETKKVLSTSAGTLFFSNVELNATEKSEISEEMSKHLYRNLASTTIDDKGVAKQNSLRTIEVTIPLVLYGEISKNEDFSATEIELLKNAMGWTRSLGSNRNRGLGRCKIELIRNL